MKKIILFALIGLCSFRLSAQIEQTPAELLIMGTSTGAQQDTAKSNTTKLQTKMVESKKGITIQYSLTHATDTVTGYVSVWGSIDGVTFCPYPGADSVAITATGNINKLWFLAQPPTTNPIRVFQVRTRCPSNTTNASSKAYIKTNIWLYN